jgi:uncharacterized protein
MTVFLDTHCVVALLDQRDQWHAEVVRYMKSHKHKYVTTEWVVVEVLNALSSISLRVPAFVTVDRMRSHPDYVIVPFDTKVYNRGLTLYRNRPDKAWSLTDCISFELMAERNLTNALTADHHFRQAGFNPIFLPSQP